MSGALSGITNKAFPSSSGEVEQEAAMLIREILNAVYSLAPSLLSTSALEYLKGTNPKLYNWVTGN